MALLGKSGLRRIAEINVARAHDACARLIAQRGFASRFSAPFFNEFVMQSENLSQLFADCTARRMVPGIPLAPWYPELKDSFLMCVTEMNEREEIDQLVRTSAG
jgi:glycine dehydrogenase subunit 1